MTSPPRLVIIDDDPKLAGVVSMIAREAYPDAADLVIECIITAEAAVLAIGRMTDDHEKALVVISDLQLPPSNVDGLSLLQMVKKRLPSAKRVLMTGHDPDDLVTLLADARLDAFVAKPFQFNEMECLIRKLVHEVVAERGPLPVIRRE